MIRSEIRAKFRAENPEITERVVPDATLNSWMQTANIEICTETRCIVSNESETFNSQIGIQSYNLEAMIENFLDIDDLPGGGVYFDDISLEKSTPGEMNRTIRRWKTSANATPRRYWMRGQYLWFDRKPDEVAEIAVDCILLPTNFNTDLQEPYNGLGHLQPYVDGINKYLQWRSKSVVGKPEESAIAYANYNRYIAWMKKKVGGAKYGPISIRPKR